MLQAAQASLQPFLFLKSLFYPLGLGLPLAEQLPLVLLDPKQGSLRSSADQESRSCFWTLAYTKQRAQGLLERVRMKLMMYKGSDPEVLASKRERGYGDAENQAVRGTSSPSPGPELQGAPGGLQGA